MENYVITISRRFGSNGHAIAGRAGELLGIPVYDRSAVEARTQTEEGAEPFREERPKEGTAPESGRSDLGVGLLKGLFRREGKAEATDEEQAEFQRQSGVIRALAAEGPCILIGRCADEIFRDDPRALHVFIFADEASRLKNSMELLHTGEEEARALIRNEDRAREAYRKRFSSRGTDELEGRHILLDSGFLGVEACAQILAKTAEHLFCG